MPVEAGCRIKPDISHCIHVLACAALLTVGDLSNEFALLSMAKVPTGPPLAVSAGRDASEFHTQFPSDASFSFDFPLNQTIMSAGVPYAIVLEYTGGSRPI